MFRCIVFVDLLRFHISISLSYIVSEHKIRNENPQLSGLFSTEAAAIKNQSNSSRSRSYNKKNAKMHTTTEEKIIEFAMKSMSGSRNNAHKAIVERENNMRNSRNIFHFSHIYSGVLKLSIPFSFDFIIIIHRI